MYLLHRENFSIGGCKTLFYSNKPVVLGKDYLLAGMRVLPGYMDMAVYDVIMYFSTMWLHFRNVATNMSYKVCSHISIEKYKTSL